MPEKQKSFHLVIQTAFLGDLLLSVGLLRGLRRLHPERRLGLVCREKLGDFFLKTGLVDEVFEIRKGDAASYRSAAARIRSLKPAAVYCPHSSVRSAMFAFSLRAPDGVAFKTTWNSWAFRRRVNRPSHLPDVLRQMSLLSPEDPQIAAEIAHYEKDGAAYSRTIEGRLSAVPKWASIGLRERLLADEIAWRSLTSRLGGVVWEGSKVLIFPGSVWATKRWTFEGFVETGRRLAERGSRIFVMGAGNEVDIATRVANEIPGATSLAGKTDLYESAMLLARSDLMIGNDSASVHLAAVAETPTVAVFGPTVIEQGFRPWSDSAWIVDRRELACRPCGPHGHHKCPRGTHECMTAVSVEEVSARASDILK